jgi:hypothetical protein
MSGSKYMDVILLTHHDNFKAFFLRNLLKKLCQKGFNFRIQYFSAIFDRPNDMIMDVIDTGSRMLDVSDRLQGLSVLRGDNTPLDRRSLSSTLLKWGGFPLAIPKKNGSEKEAQPFEIATAEL